MEVLNKKGYWLVLVLIMAALAVRTYVLYFPFFFYDYFAPPGGDPVNHLGYVNSILAGNFKVDYPPLFHILISLFSKISGGDPLQVMKWTTPLLVVLPVFSLYFFAKRFFGRNAAIIVFFLALWVANYGLVAFGDGNYPNLLAGGFFQPIAFTFIILAIVKKPKAAMLWAIIFSFLIAITHHLTTALFAAVLIVYFILLLVWNRFEKIAPNIKRVIIIFGALFLVVSAVVYFLPQRALFVGAISSFFSTGEIMSYPEHAFVLEYHNYPEMVGGFVWYVGLVALVYLILALGRDKEEVNKPAILLILSWFAVIFALSRWVGVGLPARIAREVGLPLMLAIAYMVSDFLRVAVGLKQKIFVWSALAFILVLNLQQINGGTYKSPEFFNKMVWADRGDFEKAQVLKSLTVPGENIISNPTSPYMRVFAERNFIYPPLSRIQGPENLLSYAAEINAHLVFIGKMTSANPDTKAYSQFANFSELTDALNADTAVLTELQKFSDGSKIYEIK